MTIDGAELPGEQRAVEPFLHGTGTKENVFAVGHDKVAVIELNEMVGHKQTILRCNDYSGIGIRRISECFSASLAQRSLTTPWAARIWPIAIPRIAAYLLLLIAMGSPVFAIQESQNAAQQNDAQQNDAKQDPKRRLIETDQNGIPKSPDLFARWASEIVLNTEYGNGKQAVRKWPKPPTVKIIGGTQSQRKVVVNAVKQINEVLGGTRFGKVKIAEGDQQRADMPVYLVTLRDFDRIAASHDFRVVGKNEAFFALKWDSNRNIREGVVLIAVDRFRPRQLKHVVLEEIVQAMGPSNDSADVEDSIFYSKNEGPVKLTLFDQIVLEVLYSKLNSGDRERSVRRAYRNHIIKLQRQSRRKRNHLP